MYPFTRILPILFVSLIFSFQVKSQQPGNIKVNFDIESAQAICRLLALKKVDTSKITEASKLYGNTLLIRKVKGYSGAGEDVFRRTLRELIETGGIKGQDPYNWKEVKANLTEINKLLAYLVVNQNKFVNEVQDIIGTYTPLTLTVNAKACFLVGGGALGFTIGEDPTFNVALQTIGNDIEGLKYLVAHELYHNIQDAGQQTRIKTTIEKPSYPIKATYYLLYNLWAEGIANYVGDFERIKMPKSFSKIQQEQLNKNKARIYANFYLLETLIYRQYNDTVAKYQPLYDIAYSTAFDETSYHVGYEMARKISQHNGNLAIASLVTEDPLSFVQSYIALYKSIPDDKTFIRFSATFEQIIAALSPWKNKI